MVIHRNAQGLQHREDGPAVVGSDGYEQWYWNGLQHRVGGPAITHADGFQSWWHYGQRHRIDGPAVIWPDGHREWHLNGREVSELEHWLLTGAKEVV